jgi:adenine-specific DNA-methyltransferase
MRFEKHHDVAKLVADDDAQERSRRTPVVSRRSLIDFSLLARRTAAAVNRSKLSATQKLNLCIALVRNEDIDPRLQKLAHTLRELPTDHRHYWIGTFYTLLLPQDQRRQQSTYFTRPEIARHLLRLLEQQGTDLRTARVLDPATGGAAFLSMIAARMKELGCTNRSILSRIKGIEIDPNLATLSRVLIADRLDVPEVPKNVVCVADALQLEMSQRFDLVLANPPYGRVPPEVLDGDRWNQVCHPGHINVYALFVDLCLRRAKPGARLGFVIPSSFIAGPLYCKLRASIRQRSDVKLVGQIECRKEFFLDVLQDVSLLVLERKSVRDRAPTASPTTHPVAFGRIDSGGAWNAAPSFGLPRVPQDGWVLPSTKDTARGGATLSDYGFRVSSGYFVWNRETGRMRKKRKKRGLSVPLFWACNIRANAVCQPKAKDGKGTDFVCFDNPSPAIVRGPAILLQRTTNSKQRRRLIAGRIKNSTAIAQGYVTENHTILVRPETKDADIELVCRLLNSEAVDRRYRQISGTASISALLLRALDLPTPDNLLAALATTADFEAAVEVAYALGATTKWAAAA